MSYFKVTTDLNPLGKLSVQTDQRVTVTAVIVQLCDKLYNKQMLLHPEIMFC